MATLQRFQPLLSLLYLVFLTLPLHVTAYTPLSDDTLRSIPAAGSDFDIHNSAGLLSPILIPRVPGTPGIEAVQSHFVNFFQTQLPGWQITWQNSTSTTPVTGDRQIPFRNLIMSRDPPWAQAGETSRLTLVAHYDSKINPPGFIGATDSAVPCAILMHAARSVDEALTKKWEAMVAEGAADLLDESEGVQILFLDGEEAFETWTDSDSLYGARALASEWEASAYPALSTYHTPISSISLFLLLDLLGAAEPRVPSFFKTTHWAYRAFSNIESRSRALSLLGSSAKKTNVNPSGLFLGDTERVLFGSMVQDDHLPFMARGVEVLHIIPAPFPRVWHQLDDDGEHLDGPTVEDWGRLVTAFIGEYMNLEGFFPTLAQAEARQESLRNGVHKRETRKTEL